MTEGLRRALRQFTPPGNAGHFKGFRDSLVQNLDRGCKWYADAIKKSSPLGRGKQSARPTMPDGTVTGQQPGLTFAGARPYLKICAA